MKFYFIFFITITTTIFFLSCGSPKEKNSSAENKEISFEKQDSSAPEIEVNSIENSGVDMLKVISKDEKELPSSWQIMNEEEEQLKEKNTINTDINKNEPPTLNYFVRAGGGGGGISKKNNTSKNNHTNKNTSFSTSSIANNTSNDNIVGNPYENALTEDLKKQGHTNTGKNTSAERDENAISSNNTLTLIGAVIHLDQIIKSGGRVKIRTVEAGFLNGLNIPKNSIIWGTASLSKNRILINIDRIVLNGKTINNFQANIYSKEDGQLGIYVSGLDIKKQVSSEATDIGVNTASDIGGIVGNSMGGGAVGRLTSTLIGSTGNLIRRNKDNEIEIVVPNNTKLIIK